MLRSKTKPQLLTREVNSGSNGWKEHGLGHLLNPSDPEHDDRDWIGQIWLNIVRKSLGLNATELPFGSLPAVGRVTLSSPTIITRFKDFSAGKAYFDQIKPFNFLLTLQTASFGHPPGVDPNRFHLIGPYEPNAKKWLKAAWIDQYTGKEYRITTKGPHGNRRTARVKTYADVLDEYEFHPESKCADKDGNTCGKQTVGLLKRRQITIERIVYIGKESNRLEEVESGMVQNEASVYTEYSDPRRNDWEARLRPELCKRSLASLCRDTPFSRRSLIEWRAGRSRPHAASEITLSRSLRKSIDSEAANILEPLVHLVKSFERY